MDIMDDMDNADPPKTLRDYPGEQLRAHRLSLGVSQRLLARESGVHQSVISDLERGADARWTTWKRLFSALGFRAALLPEATDDTEDFLQDEIQRRKDRMEAGRAARW